MKRKLLVGWMALLGTMPVFGQTARVQIIHNSADAAAQSVDIYANGALLLQNPLGFREASEFIDAPAGVQIDLAIAPAGTGLGGAVAFFNDVVLTAGEKYIVVANGIVSGSGYSPSPTFDLDIYQGARETATNPGKVDVLVVHGSTDAQTVDVVEDNLGATLVNDIPYGEFRGYLELDPLDYTLNVTSSSGANSYFSFNAPLSTLNLAGNALTVVASGFLQPGNNSNGESFGLWVATADGGDLIPLPLAAARIQIIHNSPDPLASSVDIYAGGLFTETIKVDNLEYRQATAFVDVPANIDLTVAIAPDNSMGPEDQLVDFTYVLEDGETYIITASGLVNPAGYNPATPFGLQVFTGAREEASNPAKTDVLVLHGSTDAPAVDVREAVLDLSLIEDFSYGEYSGYLSLDPLDYVIGVAPTGADDIARFQAPLATLELQGAALTVVASGFLNTAANQNGPSFGLWVALPSGGELIPLPGYIVTEPARVQVIHNAADLAAEEVDVYITSGFSAPIVLDNFAFRTASAFDNVISGTPIVVSVALPDSEGPEDAIATFPLALGAGESYIVVANGIVSESGYNPSPDFALDILNGAKESASDPSKTDVVVYHGATDAPAVDVVETSVPAGTIVDNIEYGEFQGYLELPTLDFTLDITTADQSAVVATYLAPLESLELEGAALCVLASGFLNPANNSGGDAFGLWVALPSGGQLIELPISVGVQENEVINNLTLYPNPANDRVVFSGEWNMGGAAEVLITDITGRQVSSTSLSNEKGFVRREINVSDLPSGSYQFQIVQGDNRSVQKFVIVR